ncbi:Holliday junction resolvase RuvX [bacterium]|nr:Holliday junction resolvase RuvX [bacterium]
MTKIFSLDYGKVRVGIASCSSILKIPTPFETFRMLDTLEKSAQALSAVLLKDKPKLIVVGLPLELSGKEGVMAQEVKQFTTLLMAQMPGVVFDFIDERLTSAQAEKAMMDLDFSRKKRAKGSDTMAACLILETYLMKHPTL